MNGDSQGGSPSGPAPGWYENVNAHDPDHEFYWDGRAWTGHSRRIAPPDLPPPTGPAYPDSSAAAVQGSQDGRAQRLAGGRPERPRDSHAPAPDRQQNASSPEVNGHRVAILPGQWLRMPHEADLERQWTGSSWSSARPARPSTPSLPNGLYADSRFPNQGYRWDGERWDPAPVPQSSVGRIPPAPLHLPDSRPADLHRPTSKSTVGEATPLTEQSADQARMWAKWKSLQAALAVGGILGFFVAFVQPTVQSLGKPPNTPYEVVAGLIDGSLAFFVTALVGGVVTYVIALDGNKRRVAAQPQFAAGHVKIVHPGRWLAAGFALPALAVLSVLAVVAITGAPNSSQPSTAAVSATSPAAQWAAWFDAEWRNSARVRDPAERSAMCAEYKADPLLLAREASNEMWRDISLSYPEARQEGLTPAILYDGFVRNLRQTCS